VSAGADLASKPEFDYDAAEVGEEYGPLEYTLTAEKLELYRRAIGDPEAIFATIASKDYANLLRTRYTLGEVVNARHETRYHRPPEVGERVRITGRLVDRYVKRDRPFIVIETISRDAAGEALVESRTTLALGRPKAGG
jgi:hypothetical protein